MVAGRKYLLSLQFVFLFVCSTSGEIINQNVERSLDISTQLAKSSLKIVLEESTGKPIKEYVIAIGEDENVAFISAKDSARRDIRVRKQQEKGNIQYVLTFATPASTQQINVDIVSSKNINPHPSEIKQNEKQLVKYSGNVYFYSPYKTKTQKTTIKLGSTNIISNSPTKPNVVNGNKIVYGPFANIEALIKEDLIIHYENQSPFLTLTHLERNIEVSHWGNIAIKENIHILHTGAKLKGSFSRYEYQKDGRFTQASVKSYKTILPASASGVYYRDTNGNISTSNMNILRDSVELELRPRFPLFGGWKTQYTLGYNVPSYEYLFVKDDIYKLKMRLIDHIYDDMIADNAVINIILPEGSTNIYLTTPYDVNRDKDGLVHTYLDTVGRPVISFSKQDLVENHIADFTLQYTFPKLRLLQEPFLVVTFIFVIFIVAIIFLRLDFSINPHAHKE